MKLNKRTLFRRSWFRIIAVLLLAAALQLVYTGYLVATTPSVIRKPTIDHYHFRMQILVDGEPVNFAEEPYQVAYIKDQCSAELPEEPIHFHDKKDQMVHIHWDGMTGGLVMKNYGWNLIGGADDSLGYRLDESKIRKISTKGRLLPGIPNGANFYIYTGDTSGHKERSLDEWKSKNLEDFFEKKSNLSASSGRSMFSRLKAVFIAKAYAHGSEVHADSDENAETGEQRLTRINNLIGNVVIFVQKDKPSEKQVKDRFNQLEPLSDSTCGG